MSFILDALKKSENERQQHSGGEFSSVPTSPASSSPARWFWLLAALLAINIAVLLGILLRPDAPSTATTAPDDLELAAEPVAQIPAELAPAAAASFEDQVERARRQQPPATSRAIAEPAPVADQAIADSAPTATTPAPAPATRGGERVPTIEELCLNGPLQLPELHIDIHVYSDNPDERFVFINMAKHREQSQLDEGPVVREITAEGVILQYQGRSFLLSRE